MTPTSVLEGPCLSDSSVSFSGGTLLSTFESKVLPLDGGGGREGESHYDMKRTGVVLVPFRG